jgi:hypothetical protein
MKTPQKAKSLLVKKTKHRRKTLLASAKLVYAKTPVIRHLRLIEPKHTGKLIGHRHTSHVTLMLILVTVGIFLYGSQGISSAARIVGGGSVTVGVVVPGPPPTVGAIITVPDNGTTINSISTIQVSGTCANNSFVVVYDNKSLAGSTSCTTNGNFSLIIQLLDGDNSLTALDFDNLNQSGPVTPSVLVKVKAPSDIITTTEPSTSTASTTSTTTVEAPMPVLPINPSIISGVTADMSTCSDYMPPTYLKTGGEPHVEFVCVPRLINPLTDKDVGLLVWGGTPPYAISLSWGADDKNTIISMPSPGYKTVNVKYDVAGFFSVAANMVDAKAHTTVANASIQVNGAPTTQNTATSVVNNIKTSITDSTVPLYILAVAITLGFWGGDVFDRFYGARYKNTNKRHTAR